jgi:hypothetical protein
MNNYEAYKVDVWCSGLAFLQAHSTQGEHRGSYEGRSKQQSITKKAARN